MVAILSRPQGVKITAPSPDGEQKTKHIEIWK